MYLCVKGIDFVSFHVFFFFGGGGILEVFR